uniref:Integrase_SAM-like_N domain-containing protein n=1 Tax=Heterorhabditis bacteriophora TaxID=37862 RepID=A0A1I7WF65_HETBA
MIAHFVSCLFSVLCGQIDPMFLQLRSKSLENLQFKFSYFSQNHHFSSFQNDSAVNKFWRYLTENGIESGQIKVLPTIGYTVRRIADVVKRSRKEEQETRKSRKGRLGRQPSVKSVGLVILMLWKLRCEEYWKNHITVKDLALERFAHGSPTRLARNFVLLFRGSLVDLMFASA